MLAVNVSIAVLAVAVVHARLLLSPDVLLYCLLWPLARLDSLVNRALLMLMNASFCLLTGA